MKKDSLSAEEATRLAALARYHILDTAPESAFDDLAALASRVLAAPIAMASFVDAKRLWCKARVGLDWSETPRESSFCQYTILQDNLFVVPDALGDPRFTASPWVVAGPKARFYAGAPLTTADGQRLGALAVIDRVPRRLDGKQEEILRALARQAMTLLELRRAADDLGRNYHQLELLRDMSRNLLACSSTSATHEILADFGRQAFPEGSGRMFFSDDASGDLVSVASWGEAFSRPERLHAGDCLALRRGQPYFFHSEDTEPICPHLERSVHSCSLCVPLESQRETFGLLTLVGEMEDAPSEAALSLAVAMAQSVALAVGHLRMRERLESQSVRDPLTGLFNRRYLEESLTRELAQASRHRLPLGLIMIDLDRFKDYNDNLGHPAGDELLRRIAQLLQRGVRAGDIACRYGGDEFAVILPGASLEITRVRAVELLGSVKRLGSGAARGPARAVTLSTGVAAFPEHGTGAQELLHAADVALYQAKAQGRDRAVVALLPAGSD